MRRRKVGGSSRAPDADIQRMADASLALVRAKFEVHRANQRMLGIAAL